MLPRYITALLVSTGVTFGLFFIMQILVGSGDTTLTKDESIRLMDMVQVERKIEPKRENRKVERPDEVEAPPPEMDMPQTEAARPTATGVSFQAASVDSGEGMGGDAFAGITDGEMIPIVRIEPQMPRRAEERGIEGYVTIKFVVTEAGTVDNVELVEEDPPGYFFRAADRAVRKWKYKPRIVDGKPVPVTQYQRFTFTFGEE